MIADYINEAIIRFITTAGHYVRDDYIFYCKGNPVKYLTSEGQKRLLYFSLALPFKKLIEKTKLYEPVFLFDDPIFVTTSWCLQYRFDTGGIA